MLAKRRRFASLRDKDQYRLMLCLPLDYESGGQTFESFRARQSNQKLGMVLIRSLGYSP
jgi:hypothetical protein